MNYNIHNLVRMQVNGDFKLKPLDMEFEYFRTDDDIEPDIVVNIGKFKPNNENCHQIDNDYFVKENYLYHKGKDWEVEIRGFEKGTTTVNYNGHLLTNVKYPSCPLTDHVLLPIIQRKLMEKGYFLTHCAGVGNVLLVGHAHSFKTTIAMRLSHEANDSLGDDYVIIKDKKMFSFPRFPSVFNYRWRYKTDEKLNLFDKIKIILLPLKSNAFGKYSEIKKIIFLTRMTQNAFVVSNSTKTEAKKRIMINQELEDSYNVYKLYTNVYKSIYDFKEPKPKIEIDGLPAYIVRFSENNIDKVVDFIEKDAL